MHEQAIALAAEQADDRQCQWVGAARRACGKHAVRACVGRRLSRQAEPLGAVENPHDVEVREPLDVGEALLERGIDLEEVWLNSDIDYG